MKIIILDDYQDVVKNLDCFELLKGRDVVILRDPDLSKERLAHKLIDADAIVLIRERTKIDDAFLSKLPKLKIISQTGKISNHLDLAACTGQGVAVAEGIGSPIAPSELCWALVLSATRHIPAYVSNLKAGIWQNSGSLGLGRNLSGLTFGIWGYGKIGKRVAQYAKAFDMRVLVWGSPSSRAQAVSDGFIAANSKDAFFENSDVLSLHLRLNENTRACVKKADLAKMKPDALFVNTSRAGLIEKNALVESLKSGNPGAAAIDVFDFEPVRNGGESLLELPNALCSPHIGYVTKNSYELYFKIAFENIISYFEGQPQNIANPEVL